MVASVFPRHPARLKKSRNNPNTLPVFLLSVITRVQRTHVANPTRPVVALGAAGLGGACAGKRSYNTRKITIGVFLIGLLQKVLQRITLGRSGRIFGLRAERQSLASCGASESPEEKHITQQSHRAQKAETF